MGTGDQLQIFYLQAEHHPGIPGVLNRSRQTPEAKYSLDKLDLVRNKVQITELEQASTSHVPQEQYFCLLSDNLFAICAT